MAGLGRRTASAPLALSRRDTLRGLALLGVLGVGAGALEGCKTAADKRVSFLNWQDYIDPALLTAFTDQSGLTVGYETYESNDDLARRLAAASVTRKGGRKKSSFDLIVPSTNLFTRLADGNALQALDTSIVTDKVLANLDPAMRELAADPGNTFSIPWATGTTGIGYDTTVFSEPPTWEVFASTEHAGKMSILNEVREAFAAAYFAIGGDPNSTSSSDIKAATAQLRKFLANAKPNSKTYLDDLANGDLVVAQGFNTDVLQAAKRNPNLAFTVPAAGGTRWTDHLCIPVDAPNPDGANQLVAFYLDPKNSAANAAYNLVDTGDAAARQLLSSDIVTNPAIYPPTDVTHALVDLRNLGDAEDLYAKAWADLTG